jgi:basic membrane protein A
MITTPTCLLARREEGTKLKVAVLHFGPVKDYGWTYEGHLGTQKMAFLPYIAISEREAAFDPDALQILKSYAEAGNKIIFCHSYEFGKHIEEVASIYPGVIFMWGSGIERKADNVGLYFGRMYQARFLTGIVAGAMTKRDMIGYAAAIPIPEVVRGIDAFARGVASVNSEAKVYVEWIGRWFDLSKERDVTLSLMDRGCDVITHHSDSYAPAKAAEERGVCFIGFGSDIRRFTPNVFLTATVWNWGPIMTEIVEAVRNGTWAERPDRDWWYGLAERGIMIVPFSELVPDNVRKIVNTKKHAIIDGKLEVFPGMSDSELRNIYYFGPSGFCVGDPIYGI